MATKSKLEKIQASPEAKSACKRMNAAREAIRKWKVEEEDARDEFLANIPDHDGVQVMDGRNKLATVTTSEPSRAVDWKAFREDHPHLPYDQYLKPATSTTTVRSG